ncbi:MAG: class E sortase [Bifidobacteriaceae bacterium]|jgi:LPXTG-site transpeptidase (sortase) family protein|nr:class E sortase [Bifidobacteriaceae bacterium]
MQKKSSTYKVLGVISKICFALAIVVALYVLYLLVWTGVIANHAQNDAITKISMDQPLDNKKSAPEYRDNWPEIAQMPDGQIIGQVYIPRFGKDYWRTLFQGTEKDMLDTMGFGHYSQSVMPGQIGNFSAAAHRNGYGASLEGIQTLQTGDALIVRTAQYWFVYKVTSYEIVDPENTGGILPVPYNNAAVPTLRLITFTTCHPEYSTQFRYIEHGAIDYWSNVKDGVPKELLNIGAQVG